MAKADYYSLLGISKGCDEKELKTAFRKRAMECHPDRHPDDKAAEQRFKEINEAYEVLKDPQKRAAYDQFGHAAFERRQWRRRRVRRFRRRRLLRHFRGHFRRDDGRRAAAAARRRERGADLRYNMEITLEEAYGGKTRGDLGSDRDLLRGLLRQRCKAGLLAQAMLHLLGFGPRAGRVRLLLDRAHLPAPARAAARSYPTPAANAADRAASRDERSLSVNIPAGIEDGVRIRLAGEGEAGARGGPSGDLYIFLSVKPHEFFQRDGADLYLPRADLDDHRRAWRPVRGDDASTAPRSQVKVPEGTQTGRQFRLKGKGMPVMRTSNMGDLYIQVAVETPHNLTRRQRELLEEFASHSSDQNNPESTGFFSRMRNFLDGLAD